MSNLKREHAIGVFDSGVGGLTVLNQIVKILPNEKIIYLGDTARLPYGDKSPETVLRYTIENAIFLMNYNIKLLVIACNTATAYAIHKIQTIFNIPIIGVIEPGAEQAVKVTRNNRIAVIGTKGTILSQAYERKIAEFSPKAEITSIPCPLFVPLVEEGLHSHSATTLIVNEYLKPLKNQTFDTLLLGCTHYPVLKKVIQEYLGPTISIVDSATTCAEKIQQTLLELSLNSQEKTPTPQQFFVTDNPDKFKDTGKKFFEGSLENISLVRNVSY